MFVEPRMEYVAKQTRSEVQTRRSENISTFGGARSSDSNWNRHIVEQKAELEEGGVGARQNQNGESKRIARITRFGMEQSVGRELDLKCKAERSGDSAGDGGSWNGTKLTLSETEAGDRNEKVFRMGENSKKVESGSSYEVRLRNDSAKITGPEFVFPIHEPSIVYLGEKNEGNSVLIQTREGVYYHVNGHEVVLFEFPEKIMFYYDYPNNPIAVSENYVFMLMLRSRVKLSDLDTNMNRKLKKRIMLTSGELKVLLDFPKTPLKVITIHSIEKPESASQTRSGDSKTPISQLMYISDDADYVFSGRKKTRLVVYENAKMSEDYEGDSDDSE